MIDNAHDGEVVNNSEVTLISRDGPTLQSPTKSNTTGAHNIKSSTAYVKPVQKTVQNSTGEQRGSKTKPAKVDSKDSTTVDPPLQNLPQVCFADNPSSFVGTLFELTKVDSKMEISSWSSLILQGPYQGQVPLSQILWMKIKNQVLSH